MARRSTASTRACRDTTVMPPFFSPRPPHRATSIASSWSRVDGSFGPLTETDVKSAQAWAGLTPDGNAGDTTKKKITF